MNHKIITCLIIINILAANDGLIYTGETHFKHIRQLTFSGETPKPTSAPMGKIDLPSSRRKRTVRSDIYYGYCQRNINRVSTGDGVTTCSYFEYPEDSKIVYASTHLGGKECPPKPDYSLGYIWKLYPDYDVFRANTDGTGLERLTHAFGYDAEATYSFDGSKIVYTSKSSGDLEVWTMNPDGSNKTQLTDKLGYDGGPFLAMMEKKLSGEHIILKTEKEIADYQHLLDIDAIRPMALQIRTMNADGTNKKQLTNNNAANFGPFFYPNDKRIIFSSNMNDPKKRNFDLYAIDIDGNNLERITHFDGFDGFPMFSPDGKYFVFASNRNQAKPGDTNIFICEWTDE